MFRQGEEQKRGISLKESKPARTGQSLNRKAESVGSVERKDILKGNALRKYNHQTVTKLKMQKLVLEKQNGQNL